MSNKSPRIVINCMEGSLFVYSLQFSPHSILMNCKSLNRIHANEFLSYIFPKNHSKNLSQLNCHDKLFKNIEFFFRFVVSFWWKIVWIKCCKLLLLITRESKKKPQRIPKKEICVEENKTRWKKLLS